jgi:hypothetical protein
MNEQADQVQQLQRENEQLRLQLAKQPAVDEDLYSYRIFMEARKKLITWLAGALVLLTAFGLYSLKEVVDTIRAKAEAKGVDSIVAEVTKSIEEEVKSDVAEVTKSLIDEVEADMYKKLEQVEENMGVQLNGVIPEMVARVESSVKEQLSRSLQEQLRRETGVLAEGVTAQPVAEQSTEASAVGSQASISQGTYYVIAGSSPRRADLEGELRRVEERVGGSFETMFPLAAIYEPLGNNINYALVVGANLQYDAALELKRRALENGFRSDTFLWNSETVSFNQTNE